MPSLDKTVKEIRANKKYGEHVILMPGEKKCDYTTPTIPTGSLGLDLAIGGGLLFKGIYEGAMTILWGAPGSGKSTAVYNIIANAQRMGKKVIITDLEYKLDRVYAEAIGVDFNALCIVDGAPSVETGPLAGEDILTVIEKLIRTNEFGLVVIDSLSAIVPRQELDGEIGDANIAVQARLATQMCRKLVGLLKTSGTALLFTNQERANFDATWGAPKTKMALAKAVEHATRLVIKFSHVGWISDTDKVRVGQNTEAYVQKNQGGAPYQKARFAIMNNTGIDWPRELIDMGETYGLVKRSGAIYKATFADDVSGEVQEVTLGQGKETSAQFLRDNTGWADRLRRSIIAAVKPTGSTQVENTEGVNLEP